MNSKRQFYQVPFSQRVLLLPHCLRPSEACPGKYTKKGLECPEDCDKECVIGRLRKFALNLGYKGVCIAPGGVLALKFVKENNPKGIVAVACAKELEAGTQGVKELVGSSELMPTIIAIPLCKEGCVDTEVDEKQVMEAIASDAFHIQGKEKHKKEK